MSYFNPYTEWARYETAEQMQGLFEKDNPVISGFDTETTGLHILKDKAFLIVFGWLIPKTTIGRVFTFYPTHENMSLFFKLAKKSRYLVGHNVTYDLSMIQNIGWKYDGGNLVENMVAARLSLEALSARLGGDAMGLKALGAKYVHPHAGNSDALVKEQLRELNRERVKVLTAALKQVDHPTEKETKPYKYDDKKGAWVKTTAKYMEKYPDSCKMVTKPKKWTKKLVEDFLKDITNDVADLPEDIQEIWKVWQEEYPEPTYEDVDRELMIKYAGEDVITMLEFFKLTLPIIKEREQGEMLRRECNLIPAIVEQERHGLKVDRRYLETCRLNLKAYIKKKRKEMYGLAGGVVNTGQDQTILKIFRTKWDIALTNCDKAALKKVLNSGTAPADAKSYAKLIIDLRRLEKWYSTYITRILKRSEYDGRIYLQLNQAGAISGRFTSDGQQFPKDPLMDDEENELFHPRKAFIADEGTKWYFLDYSQIELRVQANYTILVSGGDLNMCRAYMPFQCHGTHKGVTGEYNYREAKKRKYWKLLNFWKDENGDYWTPTDVHGQTTHNALILLGYDCQKMYESYTMAGGFFGDVLDKAEFKRVRGKGKTFNFMKNYGGGLGAAMAQLDLPQKVAQALIDGYEKAFPGVIAYGNAVADQHAKQGYVKNMFGRRYYLNDLGKSYVLNNYLVQGTAADILKEAMLKCHEYLKSQDCKTKLIMNIHDELQFSSVPGEEHHIAKCREIMEDFDWHMVPIVADMEVTTTTWAAKEEVA